MEQAEPPAGGRHLLWNQSGWTLGERRRGNGLRSRQGIRQSQTQPIRIRRTEGREEPTWPMHTGY